MIKILILYCDRDVTSIVSGVSLDSCHHHYHHHHHLYNNNAAIMPLWKKVMAREMNHKCKLLIDLVLFQCDIHLKNGDEFDNNNIHFD